MQIETLTMLEKLLIVRKMVECGEIELINMDGEYAPPGALTLGKYGALNFHLVVE
jgi:hypothetical protein